MTGFSESVVGQGALAWLEHIGWQPHNGAEIAPGEPVDEREGRFEGTGDWVGRTVW